MDLTERESAEEVQSAIEENVSKTAGKVKQFAGKAKDKAVEIGSKAHDFSHKTIREYPFWSIMAAFAVGIGIGALAMNAASD